MSLRSHLTPRTRHRLKSQVSRRSSFPVDCASIFLRSNDAGNCVQERGSSRAMDPRQPQHSGDGDPNASLEKDAPDQVGAARSHRTKLQCKGVARKHSGRISEVIVAQRAFFRKTRPPEYVRRLAEPSPCLLSWTREAVCYWIFGKTKGH